MPAAAKSYAHAPKLSFGPGQYLFATRCASCHTIGGGDKIGPDLLGVTKVRDRAWLARMLQKPDEMLAEKDAIAIALFSKYKVQMPNVRLGDGDVAALIDFLAHQTGTREGNGSASASATGAIETEH